MHPLRLFLALDTPSELKPVLASVRDNLAATGADVRWEPNEKLHCTLKFLGDTDPSRLNLIVKSLQSVATTIAPFTVRYRNVGRFPQAGDPQVIWIGMENPDGRLIALKKAIEEACAASEVKRDDRSFHAHVTLGRVKSSRHIGNLLRRMESITFVTEPTTLSAVLIVKSELKPAGSVYTILNVVPLKG